MAPTPSGLGSGTTGRGGTRAEATPALLSARGRPRAGPGAGRGPECPPGSAATAYPRGVVRVPWVRAAHGAGDRPGSGRRTHDAGPRRVPGAPCPELAAGA